MTSKTHECSACGGSGYQRCYTFPGTDLCPVCLGAGRISDQMPARDAVVDGETLRPMVKIRWRPNSTWIEPALVAAGRLGVVAESIIKAMSASRTGQEDAVFYAREAARAAFRACPMLREDR